MSVIKLVLAYDGTDFHGWAEQSRHRTIEGELGRILQRYFGAATKLSVAGRTDAGVHAQGQVVSFEAGDAEPEEVQRMINGLLAPEIVVTSATVAPQGFDARYSAVWREYRFRLHVGPVPDPFTARYVWHRPGQLNLPHMRACARVLLGEHDFASFCLATRNGSGTVRDLQKLSVARSGDRIEIVARAGGFLHQMVRSLVATLVRAGEGRIEARDVAALLEGKDRALTGRVAPARGLTFERVGYRRGPSSMVGTGRS